MRIVLKWRPLLGRIGLVGVLPLVACSGLGPVAVDDPQPLGSPKAQGGVPVPPALAASGGASAAPQLDCRGERKLEGYDYQRMVSVDLQDAGEGAAEERAVRKATAELADQLLGANLCGRDELIRAIRPFGRGRNGTVACAQVVLANDDWARFQATHRDISRALVPFRQAVEKVLAQVSAGTLQEAKSTRSTAAVRLTVAESSGDDLTKRMAQEVKAALRVHVPWQPSWSDAAIPDEVDGVLVPRWQRAANNRVSLMLEVRLHGEPGKTYVARASEAVELSACVLPPEAAPLAGAVHLDLGADPAAVCSGQQLHPKLVSTASVPLHVRVIDLWGSGSGRGAMVVWPLSADASDEVAAGATVPFFRDLDTEFFLVEQGAPSERFVVVASPDASALDREVGALRKAIGCRADKDAAARFDRLGTVRRSDLVITVTDVRFALGGACGGIDVARREKARAEVAKVPVCP